MSRGQMPRSVWKRVELPGEWKLERVLLRRASRYGAEYLGRWEGYSHFGDTWEPEDHVYPRRLITAFLKSMEVHPSLEWGIWLVRDALVRQCTSNKILERGAVFRRRLRIDGLAAPGLGRAVLDYFASLTKPALPVDVDGADTTLEATELDDISVSSNSSRSSSLISSTRLRRASTSLFVQSCERTQRWRARTSRRGAGRVGGLGRARTLSLRRMDQSAGPRVGRAPRAAARAPERSALRR